jgi:excisionase family DNA binding protein
MSVTQAAKTLCVHPNTVLKLIQECAIPAAQAGRAYFMRERDVLAYADKLITEQTNRRMGQPNESRKEK